MIRNDGNCCGATPIDADLKPQTVNETAAGVEYTAAKEFVLGFRGVYRAQGTVIEDGSFDEGRTYFVFNPGESMTRVPPAQRHLVVLAAHVVTTAPSSSPPPDASLRITSSLRRTSTQV